MAQAQLAQDAARPGDGSFLAMLTDAERASLYEIGVRREYERGSLLMLQGDCDDRVMILLEGRVKVLRTEQDGREQMLSLRDAGDLLGELAFIDGGPRLATVVALEPVAALVAPGAALRRYLEVTPRAAVVLLEQLSSRLRESSMRRAQSGTCDTMGRLAGRILELAERYGSPGKDDESVAVVSPLTQEDLAAWTGASRAGVADALRAMRELGWIRTQRREITVLDVPALRARALQG